MDARAFDENKLSSRHVTEGLARETRRFKGNARRFDGEAECFRSVRPRTYEPGDAVVIHYKSPGGRPRALRDGDMITLDAIDEVLAVDGSEAEFAGHWKDWMSLPPNFGSDALWNHVQTVGSARDGAVTHPGGSGEIHVYADV